MSRDAAGHRRSGLAGVVRATPAMRVALLAALAAGACSGPSGQADEADATGPLAVVRGQLDAFNRHSAEDLLAWVAPDVAWMNVQADSMLVEVRGREMLRAFMLTYFEAVPDVRSELEEAIVTGDFVAVRERATWRAGDGEERSQASLAVYEVRDGLIQRVWYYPVTP